MAGAEYLYLVWLPFIPQATVCHGFHLSALAMAVQLTEFKVVYRCIIRLFAKIIYKHFLQVVGIEPTVPSNPHLVALAYTGNGRIQLPKV